MAKTKGAKNWSTLAQWDNQKIYDHLMSERAYSARHAFFTVRKIRQWHDDKGVKRAQQAHVPYDFWQPNGAHPAPQTGPNYNFPPSPNAEPTQLEEALEESIEDDAAEEVPGDVVDAGSDAGNALAALIAPALAGMVATQVAAAVKKLGVQTALTPQLVVVKDKIETKLDGTHHYMAAKVIQLASQGLNVMLVGPAGCGKTVLADSLAQALKSSLTIVSCSAGMSEAQLLGRLLPIGEGGKFAYVESPFMKAYANGGVVLLDEMDAADANLLLVLNAALANGGVTVEARAASHPTTFVKRHPECVVVAAANTWGSGADTQYIGRGALDVSTLDRFYRLPVDYDTALESKLGQPATVKWVQKIRKDAQAAKLRRVVSTRMITRMERAMAAGVSFADTQVDELASWTKDERSKVGVYS